MVLLYYYFFCEEKTWGFLTDMLIYTHNKGIYIKFKRILFDKKIRSGLFKKIEHTIIVDFFFATTMQKYRSRANLPLSM